VEIVLARSALNRPPCDYLAEQILSGSWWAAALAITVQQAQHQRHHAARNQRPHRQATEKHTPIRVPIISASPPPARTS
jgi:hypothetical protein